MSIIIGINAYHSDSSACLIVNGEIVAAVEEERLNRVKHWSGLPIQSIKYCLNTRKLQFSDVDYLAINQDTKANIGKKLAYAALARPDLSLIVERIKNRRERQGLLSVLNQAFPNDNFRGKLFSVEHHHAHLASTFYVSPFSRSSIVSIDGFGDFASAAWARGDGNKIDIDDKIFFPHSLGIFYMMMTQYIGFPNWGDEYKVMGLAPYGKPLYLNELRKIVLVESDGKFRLGLEYFRHHKEKIAIDIASGEPHVAPLFTDEVVSLLGPARSKKDDLSQRHMDIARSVQELYEEAFFNLLNKIYERDNNEFLSIAGGCAMNSVANGKICLRTPFKQVYIPPASGDAGGAIGAALVALVSTEDGYRRVPMKQAYLGPEYSDSAIGELLKVKAKELILNHCSANFISADSDLTSIIAQKIAEGLVVGWFQGRMEWGPRALGNRSILCDPRRPDMKNILNLKIKRRESFRPFAPAVLVEEVEEWFEYGSEVPFMMQVYPIRKEKQQFIPAVTHVDGSGRLQTVSKETNIRFYNLIAAFHQFTGVPMIVNTSFNENEPIVCRPEEALDCFLRTKMDILVLGNWVIHRT